MLEAISWYQYWTAVIVAILAYYIVVYWFYLRGSLKGFSIRKAQASAANDQNPERRSAALSSSSSPDFEQPARDTEEYIVYACMDELTAFFENQKASKAVKSELTFSLYTILQKYPSLRHSQYKESLTNVIATQCENICSIHFSAEELKGIWLG